MFRLCLSIPLFLFHLICFEFHHSAFAHVRIPFMQWDTALTIVIVAFANTTVTADASTATVNADGNKHLTPRTHTVRDIVFFLVPLAQW